MAIAYIQQSTVTGASVSSLTSASLTFTSGNIIVVGTGVANTTNTLSMSDSNGGNTWTLAIGPIDNTRRLYQYYAANIIGATYTVTSTVDTGSVNMSLVLAEYSGIATASPLDQTGSGGGTSTALDISSALNTTQADELLVGVSIASNASINWTAGSNYTLRSVNTSRSGLEDRIVSSTGSYLSPFTSDISTTWVMILGTYKASGGGPPPGSPYLSIKGRPIRPAMFSPGLPR